MRDHEALNFSIKEYKRRLDGVRSEMEKKGLDLMMINDPQNLAYLTGHQTTGYGTFQALFVPLESEPFSYSRFLESSNFISRTWVEENLFYRDFEDPIPLIVPSLKNRGFSGKTMGFEARCFFLDGARRKEISEIFPVKMVDASGLVETQRVVKSPAELDMMRRSAIATQAGTKAALEAIQVGKTENDLAAACHHAMYSAGGEYPAVAPYITSGPRTTIGHATWEGRTINKNECVFIEVGGCYRRYHTAMMRTAFTGKPPQNMLDGEKIVLENLDTCIDRMKPGTLAGEIDDILQVGIKHFNIGAIKASRAGYSIGIAYAPSWDEGHIMSLIKDSETPIQENMTFHIIPWLVFPNEHFVVGISETVYITPNGAKSFFDHPDRSILRVT